MLMRFDPFRELDRLTEQLFEPLWRSGAMPMDAYRDGDKFVVHVDMPGIDPSSIDLTVEKNVLTISGQRRWEPGDDVQVVASERPHGRFSRQLFLGESLDTEHVSASYEHGVLTITVPVVEAAKPRKVEISTNGWHPAAIETTATESTPSESAETTAAAA